MAQGTSGAPGDDQSRGPILTASELEEISNLRRRGFWICLYLALVAMAAFFAGAFLLVMAGELVRVAAAALIGACGSAVAALTSCLDRYANGFELEGGRKVPAPDPKNGKKETFNARMARWFAFRPVLGVVVAPVFIWGIEYFVNEPDKFTASSSKIGFSAFMAGLLAKSVIDLIKGLFKNIFKA